MKIQFDHLLQSSFYLWVDDQVTREAQAITSGVYQNFTYSDLATDIPSNLVAYYAQDRQLVANGTGGAVRETPGPIPENAPSGVYINGVFTNQFTNNLMIDFDQGRVVMDASLGTSLEVSGDFDRKNVNVYVTNDSEVELLNRDFVLASDGNTWLKKENDLGEKTYTVPGIFISANNSVNDPFAFGGLDQTRTDMRMVCITQDNYTLDGLLSLFRDKENTELPLFSYDAFPFGEYFHIKVPPYTYTGLKANNPNNKKAFIEKVTTSKLYDRSSLKIHKGLLIGFVDVKLNVVRLPRTDPIDVGPGPIVPAGGAIVLIEDETESMVTIGGDPLHTIAP